MTTEQASTTVTFNPEGIPNELKRRRQWVTWQWEWRDGELTKVPYIPGEKKRASSTDMETWRTFEEALEEYEAGKRDGVGFVFSSGDAYSGVDLDACRNTETGEIDPWAQEWIKRFDSYTEISPSGKGVHIIVKGKTPHDGKRTVNGQVVEIYSKERFFTFSGVRP